MRAGASVERALAPLAKLPRGARDGQRRVADAAAAVCAGFASDAGATSRLVTRTVNSASSWEVGVLLLRDIAQSGAKAGQLAWNNWLAAAVKNAGRRGGWTASLTVANATRAAEEGGALTRGAATCDAVDQALVLGTLRQWHVALGLAATAAARHPASHDAYVSHAMRVHAERGSWSEAVGLLAGLRGVPPARAFHWMMYGMAAVGVQHPSGLWRVACRVYNRLLQLHDPPLNVSLSLCNVLSKARQWRSALHVASSFCRWDAPRTGVLSQHESLWTVALRAVEAARLPDAVDAIVRHASSHDTSAHRLRYAAAVVAAKRPVSASRLDTARELLWSGIRAAAADNPRVARAAGVDARRSSDGKHAPYVNGAVVERAIDQFVAACSRSEHAMAWMYALSAFRVACELRRDGDSQNQRFLDGAWRSSAPAHTFASPAALSAVAAVLSQHAATVPDAARAAATVSAAARGAASSTQRGELADAAANMAIAVLSAQGAGAWQDAVEWLGSAAGDGTGAFEARRRCVDAIAAAPPAAPRLGHVPSWVVAVRIAALQPQCPHVTAAAASVCRAANKGHVLTAHDPARASGVAAAAPLVDAIRGMTRAQVEERLLLETQGLDRRAAAEVLRAVCDGYAIAPPAVRGRVVAAAQSVTRRVRAGPINSAAVTATMYDAAVRAGDWYRAAFFLHRMDAADVTDMVGVVHAMLGDADGAADAARVRSTADATVAAAIAAAQQRPQVAAAAAQACCRLLLQAAAWEAAVRVVWDVHGAIPAAAPVADFAPLTAATVDVVRHMNRAGSGTPANAVWVWAEGAGLVSWRDAAALLAET